MHIPTICILGIFLINHASLLMPLNLPLLIATILIANAITYFFYKLFKKNSFAPWSFSTGFIITACAFLSLYAFSYGSRTQVTLLDSAIIGSAQAFSLLPGISRLALTFISGCWIGLAPHTSFLFSLLIEFVLVLGAVAKTTFENPQAVTDIAKNVLTNWMCIAILGVSSFCSYFVLKLVLAMAINKTIIIFGWYLLILGLLLKLFKNHQN